MQMLNKTEQIAHLQGKDKMESQNAIHDMLIAYRSTPHPATAVSPYEAMRGTAIRTKLDYIAPNQQTSEEDERMNKNDAKYKEKMKTQRENKRTKEKRLLLGDYVLVEQEKKNKWSTVYEPIFYTVYDIQGSKITARRTTDGRTICRDASYFKLINAVMDTADEIETTTLKPEQQTRVDIKQEDSRERTLREVSTQDKVDSKEIERNEGEQMELTDKSTGTTKVKQEKEGKEPEPENQGEAGRPRRERRIPKRFEDYYVYT